ncbi:activating transcription factor-2 isoform X2 [Andrena cerasifolii]|uniref:activating transcription factor-2 isoform X2 n=1 Tax=Andrena cerasifolii TaxID=2819439 RepID=UPI004037FC1A
MMADTGKPFTCSSSGCNMSFITEDQLRIHKKKHDMMLNLGSGSKNNGFMADQTPTPTRFIRNCEEVGLFQDLQNVNPFEETFRRAVESGTTGALTVPESGIIDDTLHTPHIFPHIADVLSGNNQILSESSVQECTSSISITEKVTDERTTIDAGVCSGVKFSGSEEQDKLMTDKNEALTEAIINHVTNTPIISRVLQEQATPQLSINGVDVQLLLKTSDGKLMQLSAIPVGGFTNSNTTQLIKQQTVVIKTEPPLQCASQGELKKPLGSALSLAKMKLKQALAKNTDLQNQKPDDNSEKSESINSRKENRSKPMQDQIKKKDTLERNRASSMRARAKRKAWIQQLERTVANVNETNVALQMEIKVLRAEVAKLKTLLLAHKDCPVTRGMQKDPKIISFHSGLVTTPPLLGTALKRSTSISATEVPIVPKKKFSLAASKNPVIFPKMDCNTNVSIPNAMLIKAVPALKFMGVGQLLAEKEDTKQILIVQNPQRKLENATRQIIQINPNYEIESAAPKSS